jgi:tetratricopeptide (TPR) repeat protein
VAEEQAIFVSFASADKRWAAWIREELERAGHSVVAKQYGLNPGSSWKLELEGELARAGPALAIVSPDYIATLRGRSIRDLLGTSRAAAVRVRECEPSRTLDGIELENLVGLDEEAARESLLHIADKIDDVPNRGVRRGGKVDFPGTVPPIWHVPASRNPEFLGRTDLLNEMHSALNSGRIVVLTGIAGVGKTELAREYAYRHAGEYSLVWWLRGNSNEQLEVDLGELARRIRPRGGDTLRSIRRWVSLHADWLLVFDELSDQDSLQSVLPKRRRGHAIVTSSAVIRDDRHQVINVPAMRRAEAIEYLLGNTDEVHSEHAATVADLVGNNPSALQVVAEAAKAPNVSLGDLAAALEPDATAEDPLRATLTTPIEAQLRSLGQASPGALEFLEVISFLAPDDIPLGLFADREDVGSFVAALLDRGFVRVGNNGIFVNRLARAAARDAMPEQKALERVEAALGVVCDAFAYQVEYNENWTVTARMLPHARKVASHAERRGAEPITVSWLLNQVGLYDLQRANYMEAADALQRALGLAEQAFPEDDPSVGVIATNLGSALHNLGELADAEKLARRSVEILGATEQHPAELSIALANLAGVLREKRDFDGARAALERAIEVAKMSLGPEDPVVALRLNDLGRVLREQGDLEAARDRLERAHDLIVDRKDLGAPRVAPILWNLGEVRRELEDYDNSRRVLESALPMVESWYGPSHPETAKYSRSLGLTHYAAGNYDEAIGLLRRALAIDESALGPDHPVVTADTDALKIVLGALADGSVETLVKGFE